MHLQLTPINYTNFFPKRAPAVHYVKIEWIALASLASLNKSSGNHLDPYVYYTCTYVINVDLLIWRFDSKD